MKSVSNHLTFLLASMIGIGLAWQAEAAGLYTSGHGDVRIGYQSGMLSFRYQLDYTAVVDGAEVGTFEGGPVSFQTNELVVFVPDLPLLQPPGAEWDFLGAGEGSPLWLIPEVQEFDRPWLGFSTQDLNSPDWVGDFRLTVTGLSGPAGANLSLFPVNPVGEPMIWFTTADGIDGSDTLNLGIGTHAHTNWIFTEPGIYEIQFKISGQHVSDGFKEATGTYTFAVATVPEPGSAVLLGMGCLQVLVGLRARRNAASIRGATSSASGDPDGAPHSHL